MVVVTHIITTLLWAMSGTGTYFNSICSFVIEVRPPWRDFHDRLSLLNVNTLDVLLILLGVDWYQIEYKASLDTRPDIFRVWMLLVWDELHRFIQVRRHKDDPYNVTE